MEYIEIGKIHKAHGLKGELKISVSPLYMAEFLSLECLFLARDKESKLPYFIERIKEGQTILLKLEEVDRRQEAELLAHKLIFARREDISLTDEEIEQNWSNLAYAYLRGYDMADTHLGQIGKILSVEDFPQQEMARVLHQNRERYIPLVKHWIQSIDEKTKKVIVALPEGLLD